MIRNLGQVAAIYIGSSAPRNTNLIWLDNTVVPFVFRAYDGSAWSEIATHKWVRAYVDGWLVTLPPRQLADDGDYMLINSNNVNYKITVKDFVKSAVGNPLDFKGVIRVSADFPNPSTLESGDMYVIITSPAGGTVTDPYSGKTFEDSEKIVWDEVTQSWESLGKIDITVDLTTSYSETEVTIHSSAGKETTIQGATDQLAGVMLPGQYSWLQALSNGSIVPGDPSPLTPLTPAHKHNYSDIVNRLVSQQGTGESTIDPMSQKATTDALNLKFDKASVLQVSGAATDKVMSQKAVTDALKTLSDDFNNKLTNYLPLSGGNMKGNIVFNNNLFLNWKDTKGSTYQVLSMKSNDEINIGNAAFPLNLYSKEDLFHKRNGESAYKIWDAYNLPDPVTLSGNNTFTGNNTFQAGKFNVGPFKVTSSGSLLLNISSPAGSAWSRRLVFRANNDIPSSLVFGGYNSVDNTSIGYVYIGIGDVNHSTAQYKFYANSLKVPYKWSIDGPDGDAIIWSQTSEIVNLGRAAGTTKIRSGNTDLIHTKDSTEYIIWDKSNLPTPASTTDLANYLPLAGGTLTGQLTIKQSIDIKLRLQSTDADNHCIIQAINSQASQLGVFGYAEDKWAIGHNGTYYEIWDKYNLTNPVRYALDASNYPTLLDSNGSSFSYIKAGPSGILPNTSVSLSSGGIGYCGTLGWSFKDGYFANVHTYKILIGPNDAFIDGQGGDSSHRGIGFYTSQNAACPVYVGSLCVSDSYNNGAPYIPTNGIYSKGNIRTSGWLTFEDNEWTDTGWAYKDTKGSIKVLSVINETNNKPTSYGSVLQFNSRRGHWCTQIWCDQTNAAGVIGTLRFRTTKSYASTEWNPWTSLVTEFDLNSYLTKTKASTLYYPYNGRGYLSITSTGKPVMSNNQGYAVKDKDGNEREVLWMGTNNALYLGNTSQYTLGQLDLRCTTLTHNGNKIATQNYVTNQLSNYLPLTGGTLSGNLTINTVGSTTFVINNNDTNGSETFMRVLRKGTASAAIGFRDSLGAYIYNYNSNKYLFIDNDGYARVGTTSGSTRLALITDIPTVSGYLPLTGGTLTGTLSINSGGSEPLIINNSASAGEAYVVTKTQGTTRGVMGWNSSLGMFLQDNRGYTFSVKADGVYFGASSSTLTKLPTSTDLSGYLPLAGGTMSGNISFNGGTGRIVVGARETSNFVRAVSFNKGSATNSAYIGYHSTGGSDSSGALILVPYSTSSNPWDKTVGLYIAKNELLLDGKTIATTDQIPSIPSISISNSGSGNAVTSITASGHTLTVTKGATYLTSSSLDGYATQTWVNNKGYLTSHQTIYDLTFQAGTFSAKTFDPNGAAATVNIPTNTSHLTNDSGFITSSALNGYATQSWANGQFASLSLYNTTRSYATIRTKGNEFCLGNTAATSASNQMLVNHRIPSGCTYAPTSWVWRAGSSSSYAEGKWGNLYMNDNLVATQTWVNNKGYLTSHQTIYDLTFQAGTFSAKTFDPNGAAATVNIPTNTSHLTNDSGFITSSALNGYATQTWVNSQNFVKSTSTKKVTDIQPVDVLPATQASGVLYLVFG